MTAANAASCADGYALAKQGQAGRAIGIATSGAFVSTLIGVICLALFTPLLAEVALSFGAFEFFWLALLGVVTSGNIVAVDPLKGWLAGFLGLFVACIGQEGMYAYERFSFGNADLAGGFSLIPVLVGAFGFSEVLTVMSERTGRPKIMEFGSALPRVRFLVGTFRRTSRVTRISHNAFSLNSSSATRTSFDSLASNSMEALAPLKSYRWATSFRAWFSALSTS